MYVAGYPGTLAFLFWRNKELIIEDQLLRAKGVGNDRLTNPNAYELRRMFSRVYYQYKPDYYFWTLAVILRKFFIAFVSLMFAKNASFQLAACLLVMFIAYAFQVWAPVCRFTCNMWACFKHSVPHGVLYSVVLTSTLSRLCVFMSLLVS